jgi:hypothetical protein
VGFRKILSLDCFTPNDHFDFEHRFRKNPFPEKAREVVLCEDWWDLGRFLSLDCFTPNDHFDFEHRFLFRVVIPRG